MKDIKDVIIIGAGPAGLSAALYTTRAELKTLIIYDGAPGGKLLNTHLVDNYIGMPNTTGVVMALKMYEHAINLGIEELNEKVVDIKDASEKIKTVITSSGKELKTKSIIIASGSKPKSLDVSGYQEYFGKGVSTCVVCDGAFHRGKDIIVIGGGLSAAEESLYSEGIIGKITILNKYPSLKIDEAVSNKIKFANHIEVLNNIEVKEIIGDGKKVLSVRYLDENKKEHNKEVSGVFVYEGWKPANRFLKNTQLFNADGFIEINHETNETKIHGIYVVGDIAKSKYKQISIAVADGAKAALSAKEMLTLEK